MTTHTDEKIDQILAGLTLAASLLVKQSNMIECLATEIQELQKQFCILEEWSQSPYAPGPWPEEETNQPQPF